MSMVKWWNSAMNLRWNDMMDIFKIGEIPVSKWWHGKIKRRYYIQNQMHLPAFTCTNISIFDMINVV